MVRFALLAFVIHGCISWVPPWGDGVPDPVVVEPEGTHMCNEACDNFRNLGCEEGDDLPDGTTCEAFCRYAQKNGHWLDPECAANIVVCEELEAACGHAGGL